jgi:hypothetical protein
MTTNNDESFHSKRLQIHQAYLNVLDPVAHKLGFVQGKLVGEANAFTWALEYLNLSVTFTLWIQPNRRDRFQLPFGYATIRCPAVYNLAQNVEVTSDVKIDRVNHIVQIGDKIENWGVGAQSVELSKVSIDGCIKNATLIAQDFLPWIASIKTIANLDTMLHPNGAVIKPTVKADESFVYLAVAYLARNPLLGEIQNNWVELAKARSELDVKFNYSDILATIAYMNANPLSI